MDHLERIRTFSERINSEYFVEGRLGEGDFASVFRATRRSDGLPVALKKVHKFKGRYTKIPGQVKRLPMEVLALQKLSDPGCPYLIKFIDWLEEGDYFVIVLERPEHSVALDELIQSWHGQVNENHAKLIMKQLVVAAKYCEDQGFIHRDIKPENVLINPNTLEVKLIDFGWASPVRQQFFSGVAGTPDFFPPEYLRQEEYLGRPTTIWTLGMVLYEMLCGSLPFSSEREILTLTPVYQWSAFRGVTNTTAKVLTIKCLEKSPRNRPTLEKILDNAWLSSVTLPE